MKLNKVNLQREIIEDLGKIIEAFDLLSDRASEEIIDV